MQLKFPLIELTWIPLGVNSRWLAIRVDALGAIMVLAVALMAANGVNGVSSSQM